MLEGKKAVVTGSTRGIGRAIALELAKHGADVAIIGTTQGPAAKEVVVEALGYGVTAKFYSCDVSDFEAAGEVCKAIAADFGGVDILVNNAGVTRDNLLLRMSEDDFDTVIGVNLKGAFNITKHLSRFLIKSSGGRIINISSVSGLMGNAGQINYSASKAGLIGMTKTLAKEFAGKSVTCNAIAPGFIETDMTAVLSDEISENIKKSIPLKRFGKAHDVAALALFLASGSAAYITGEVIRVDGGMCI